MNQFTEQGFLVDHRTWTLKLMNQIAKREEITITPLHLAAIHYLREYYEKFEDSPTQRRLINELKEKADPDINSITLHKIFSDNPIKVLSKLAGLPKPKRCL